MNAQDIAAAIAAVAAALGIGMTVRKRLSGDNAEMAKEKAETGIISRLERAAEKERERADEADARADALALELAEARAALKALRLDLSREIIKRRHRQEMLPADVQKILDETRPADFDDRPEPPKAKP